MKETEILFNKGIDIKSVNVIINAGAGISFIKAVQRLGRGLRVTEDKKTVDYYDFMDKNSRIFERQSNIRRRIYEKEGYEVSEISF